jgi:hypothetical protein
MGYKVVEQDLLTIQYHSNLLAMAFIENVIEKRCFSSTQIAFRPVSVI